MIHFLQSAHAIMPGVLVFLLGGPLGSSPSSPAPRLRLPPLGFGGSAGRASGPSPTAACAPGTGAGVAGALAAPPTGPLLPSWMALALLPPSQVCSSWSFQVFLKSSLCTTSNHRNFIPLCIASSCTNGNPNAMHFLQ
eukprot:5233862-Pyramimonas_sp.AAC.1